MKPKILLGVTGSVAAIKTPELVRQLSEIGEVKVTATESALHFFKLEDVEVPVLRDKDEWGESYERGQEIPHIELGKWADVLVIAPLSADTLAKLAHGRCNNLLTCLVRAWNREKPVLLAPAMNTNMWEHPATAEHLEKLGQWHRLQTINPIEKSLACGDVGMGAMAEVGEICEVVKTCEFHQLC